MAASRMISQCGFLPWSRSRCLWAFSIMMMTASTIAPMAMAMPPSDMMFELMPCPNMTRNAISTATGKMMMATSALRRCSRNARHTSATTMLSSMQFFFERGDRAVNQRGAVVGDGDFHVRRQRLHRLVQPLFHVLNHLVGVRAVAHDDDAADRFAVAVQIGDATAHRRGRTGRSPRRAAKSARRSRRRPTATFFRSSRF